MKLLQQIAVTYAGKERKIELYNGDLAGLSKDQFVDLLVVSAFPNDYTPLPESLIGALYAKGLSVYDLSLDKEEDMRQELGCWFSKELNDDSQKQLNIKRILCFEPLIQSESADEVVGNIFRCINTFVFDEQINVVAMPIVASGKQRYPLSEMCRALLEAAIFWLEKGLPLDAIRLVHKNPATLQVLEDIFKEEAAGRQIRNSSSSGTFERGTEIEDSDNGSYPASPSTEIVNMEAIGTAKDGTNYISHSEKQPVPTVPVNVNSYDIFVSYSHKQKDAAYCFVSALRTEMPGIKIFFDDNSIPKGAQWLKKISDAIDASGKVVVFISPEYTQSRICWDEFQCAKLREYNSDAEILITIYLKSHDKLPTIFQLNNWIDCREADEGKIKAACNEVVQALTSKK